MDFLRPFLLPVLICVIVVTMWKAASYKQNQADRRRAHHTPAWAADNDEPVIVGSMADRSLEPQ